MGQISCDHCRKVILIADIGDMYSVRVDSRGYSVEVARGVMDDALHYCCETCMFERRQGVIDPALFNRALLYIYG